MKPDSSSIDMPVTNEYQELVRSDRFSAAKNELIQTIAEEGRKLRQLRLQPRSEGARQLYARMLEDYVADRGAEPFFRFLSSGMGSGPFVELVDGTVKYDMITGIGIQFFGYNHPALLGEAIDALPSQLMQGPLEPGWEAAALLRAVLARVGQKCRLRHGWLSTSGALANDVALKIIRQKHAPATKVLTFRGTFSGRSIAMQELTDNPKYREGQPVYGEVEYVPFFNPEAGLEGSLKATISALREHLDRYPGKFAAFVTELVQGEGGFRVAPREFYERVFEEAKKAGLAIWIDEVQTFGRTGSYFAYQKLGLEPWVDVVTVGKMLQVCLTLYAPEYNPRPGLLSATFTGSTAALRAGRRAIELLDEEGLLGPNGRIEALGRRFAAGLRSLTESKNGHPPLIREVRAFGGMIAFVPLDGTLDQVKAVLMRLFDLGVVAFYCGHGPHLIRMLPPLGAMDESQVDEVCSIIENAIWRT